MFVVMFGVMDRRIEVIKVQERNAKLIKVSLQARCRFVACFIGVDYLT